MKHRPVRLIRQVELQAPLDLLAMHGAPLGEILARANLPERLQEPARGFLPARQLLAFFAGCARYLGMEDFAFRSVLVASGSKVGSWGSLIPRCWRLRDALHCFCVQIVGDAPFLEAGLHYGAEHAWLWRRRHLPPKDPFAERQGEQYTLGSMLRVVQSAAGPSWKPPAVRAESPASDWLLRAEGLRESRMRFGGRAMAIAVPYDLLDLRLPRGTPSDPLSAGNEMPPAASDLAGSLQQALTPLLGAVPLSLELGAEIADTRPRTLRRWLREEGTSFRGILDRVHFEAAEERLREPTLSLAEISADLGYADQPNFTRAFRRWTGETPAAYRRRRLPQ
ncbi:MAG: helix-turn-helix domain-containing protein [Planctomycetota bacterium]